MTHKLSGLELRVDFAVEGGMIVLFGPSGCGKTTTLNCLAGLISPDSGLIQVNEKMFFDSQARINLSPQMRRVGYVFQNSALFPHLDVRRNILFGIDDWNKEKQKQKLEYLVELVHLNGLLDRRPDQLSGGQIQRVALARALAPEPQLLLLDEPFSSLDMDLRSQLAEELCRVQASLEVPVILVTHSKEEARQLADTVICMEAGKIRAAGSPAEVL